jgi:hypothetical protein
MRHQTVDIPASKAKKGCINCISKWRFHRKFWWSKIRKQSKCFKSNTKIHWH